MIGAILAAVALAWYGYHLWETRHFVPVGLATSLNKTDDEVPVITTLHEYLEWGNSDETTGKSVSFTFPRGHYTFGGNARGGPQLAIGVSVDRYTLDRIDTRVEFEKLKSPYMPKSNAYILERLGARNLGIRVYTNKSINFVGDYESIQEAVAERSVKPLASFCGMVWFLQHEVDDWRNSSNETAPSAEPSPVFGYGAALIGYLEGSGIDSARTSLYCNAELAYCLFDAPFEDWTMSFRMPRASLCEWPTELARVQAYLAQHVSQRTSRRPAE
jgi:hypothetical protein